MKKKNPWTIQKLSMNIYIQQNRKAEYSPKGTPCDQYHIKNRRHSLNIHKRCLFVESICLIVWTRNTNTNKHKHTEKKGDERIHQLKWDPNHQEWWWWCGWCFQIGKPLKLTEWQIQIRESEKKLRSNIIPVGCEWSGVIIIIIIIR